MDSYINVGNLKVINAELSNYCNAACPMCPRFDLNLNLVKDITNNSHTKLETIKNNIGPNILSQLDRFYSCGGVGEGTMNPEFLEIYQYIRSCHFFSSLQQKLGCLFEPRLLQQESYPYQQTC